MQAYLLTSRPITDALVAARKRGIDVRVLMDGGQLDKNANDRLRQLRGPASGLAGDRLPQCPQQGDHHRCQPGLGHGDHR
jgi:hypothetical protein